MRRMPPRHWTLYLHCFHLIPLRLSGCGSSKAVSLRLSESNPVYETLEVTGDLQAVHEFDAAIALA
jgi:hypothetical protein